MLSNPQPTVLHTLPPEIRQTIYHLTVSWRMEEIPSDPNLNPSGYPPAKRIPNLLRTLRSSSSSQDLYVEALSAFYLINTVVLNPHASYSPLDLSPRALMIRKWKFVPLQDLFHSYSSA